MSDEKKGMITILGLGPGDPALLTRQAWAWLQSIPEVYLRTAQHPTVEGFPQGLKIHSFDELYNGAERFEEVYSAIVERILELGRRPEGVTYAVPGHPFVAEATGPEIVKRAREMGIQVQVIEGMSFIDPVMTALEVDPAPQMALVDALALGGNYAPAFPPTFPALISQIYSREIASEVKLTLNAVYPDEHPVRLVHGAGTADVRVEELALYQIDRSTHTGLLTVLYVPPLDPDTSFESFQDIIAHLRAPEGCPWDREQTHQSLRTHLLEETYETIAALDENNLESLKEELGDLLLQIGLHAQIAVEEGEFSMADVIQGISQKLIRRHPHVFGEVQVDSAPELLKNWEKLKEEERKENPSNHSQGLLDSIPSILPALSQAQKYQERTARVGFDWADIQPVIDKVREELDEVLQAGDDEARARELGDLLFAVVNLVRWYNVDAESTLRETNQRFRQRFRHIEQRAHAQGHNLTDLTLQQMDVFWDEAKKLERPNSG
ncbi:MAG: nucleoside triphosphate pyrophosphohydrolase [Anaerolineaceae bacterium]|nr:nucleoside triphosphate pyrophosphohydrolase [Anaerolineaceae bacterium]